MLAAAPQTLAGDTTGWMPAVGGGSRIGARGSKPQKKNSRHKKKSASRRQKKERQRRKERKLKSKMKKVKAELNRAKAKHRRRRGDPSDPSSSSSSSSYTSPSDSSDSSTDSEDDTDSDHHDESSDQTGSGSDVSVKDSDILPKKKKKRARRSRSLKENSARSKALKLALSFLKQPFSKALFDQQQEVVLAIAIATLNKRVYAELYHYLNGHFQDLLIGIPKDDGIGLYHALLGRCQQRSIHEETEARQCYAQTRMDVSSNSRFKVVGAWENFVMIEARLFAIDKWYQSVRTIIAGEEGEVSLHTPRSLMVHVRNYLPRRYDPFLLYLELQDENMRSNKGREMTWPEVRQCVILWEKKRNWGGPGSLIKNRHYDKAFTPPGVDAKGKQLSRHRQPSPAGQAGHVTEVFTDVAVGAGGTGRCQVADNQSHAAWVQDGTLGFGPV